MRSKCLFVFCFLQIVASIITWVQKCYLTKPKIPNYNVKYLKPNLKMLKLLKNHFKLDCILL